MKRKGGNKVKIGDNYQNIQNSYAYVNANNVAAASKVAAEKKDGSADAAAVGAATPNTDRAEFSADTKVTNKMSDSERAALVESLKSDLDNQMSRFTNMMMQTFNKQGITGLTAGSDAFLASDRKRQLYRRCPDQGRGSAGYFRRRILGSKADLTENLRHGEGACGRRSR